MKTASFMCLTLQQWGWLLSAWWRLWVVRAHLRFSRLDWLMGELAEQTDKTPRSNRQSAVETAEAMHESVRLAERCHPLASACLPKSTVLTLMLRARGIVGQLRIGVSSVQNANRSASALVSHAWVEVEGEPICEVDSVTEKFNVVSLAEGMNLI